ncbi:MAG: isoleucine--tRNA ligase [Clostridia bacterium]|nr:isoleucine--tRNA ligase [Clostridia bacterium]
MPKDYKDTLNLPSTAFSMRANLPQREPGILEGWNELDLYGEMLKKAEGKPLFVLHDGPPFSNGNIHMGHVLNKILKDFINKYKAMTGYRVPFVPGWDNHGMPIESAIIKQNKLDRKKMSIPEFRNACHDFAQNFIDLQRESFERLGVVADWKHPYVTMAPSFEAREVKVFGEMYRNGYIYKGLKPVYWCAHDETALAEAEIEYQNDKCTSIYVKFRVHDDKGKLSDICDLNRTYFIIWTTTTWTLPGNLAIALHPVNKYAVIKAGGDYYITAEALAEETMRAAGITDFEIVRVMRGGEFEYMTAYHPFLERDSLVVNADYVTLDSGTGCVHTAPGFGADDYLTGRKYGLDIVVPVDDRGYQTKDAGKYAGIYYEESNKVIFDDLKESGALFASAETEHSYPHCWRCKNPVIFRATPQWFCSVDAFKDDAVKACAEVEWLPAWGGERIAQMVRERADWCISRQRHWGLPIPVFYCRECGKPICNEETIEKISRVFGVRGSNAWYDMEPSEILGEDFRCPFCGADHFERETDTLDGWFDSGSTHYAVIEDGNAEGWISKWPADIYLEGADQYRGWFQSSLLTSVGCGKGSAPFRTVLTHGWVVDGEGKAMHKSLGNDVKAADVIKVYGADILRLWVASSDYRIDVRVSDLIFKQLCETYRKIRNTARIILANIGDADENGNPTDFDPNRDMVDVKDMYPIDRWLLASYNRLIEDVTESFDRYEFHMIYHAVNNFCTVTLSKLYIDITKDRVYVEKKDGKARRSAQSAMYIVLSGLVRMIAPMISFTADEIWHYMPHLASDDTRSVMLNDMPRADDSYRCPEIEERYNRLFELRDDVLKALELSRAEKVIGKSLDARIEIYTEDSGIADLLESFGKELNDIFIVSDTAVRREKAPDDAIQGMSSAISVLVGKADGFKCDRCWSYSDDGEKTEDGYICRRCSSVISGR